MSRWVFVVMFFCLGLFGCRQSGVEKEVIQRSFYNTIWERFDYVDNDVQVNASTTFDLSLRISFTDDYPYGDFSMVFTIFDEKGNPYRAKSYQFKLKDQEGNWNVEKKDDCYTFILPINKQLTISDLGKYKFRIEQKQPITPLVGVKELVLINE